MKIGTIKNFDESSIGDVEDIQAGIDENSKAFLFEMMSKSLYSNPIGSIVREITSNCFDSHKEAGIEDAVVIKKGNDEEGDFISFIDIGVGLSPDRIKNIYMKYFSSTKRDTNDQIGGFGLGSKTPLSYTDSFYINTVFEKTKYMYVFSKGREFPTLSLLDASETTERNGTEIRIYIKNYNDEQKFKNELIKQLCYFDNVVFDSRWGIQNDYKIYEGDTFKFKSVDQYESNLHIVLGKVAYPIDWESIEIEPVNIACGIRFEIGELEVTPNREAIRYTDTSIPLIKEKIQKVIDELTEMYIQQNTMFDSFFAWYEKKNQKPYVKFGEEDKVFLYGIDGIDKRHKYKYLEGLEFLKDEDILGLFYKTLGSVSEGKSKDFSTYNVTKEIMNSPTLCRWTKSSALSGDKNWLCGNGYVFRESLNKSSIDSQMFREIGTNKHKFLASTSKNSLGWTTNVYEYRVKNTIEPYFDLGIGMKLHRLVKALREEIRTTLKEYRGLTLDETNQYREWRKDKDANYQRKINQKVYVKSISEDKEYDWKVDQIEHYTGIIIYGNRDNTHALQKAVTFLTQLEGFKIPDESRYKINRYLNPKSCKVLLISQANEKYFKNKKNMTHVKDLYSDNKLFRRLASSFKIEEFFINYTLYRSDNAVDFINQMTAICPSLGDNLSKIKEYHKKNSLENNHKVGNSQYDRSHIKQPVLDIAKEFNLFDPTIESAYKEVETWFKDVEILRFTEINDDSLPYILTYLKQKGKKLNIEYYCKYVLKDKEKDQLAFVFDEPETKLNFINLKKQA